MSRFWTKYLPSQSDRLNQAISARSSNRSHVLNQKSNDQNQMHSGWWGIAGAVVGVLIATIIWAPASWLAAVVSHYSAGYVRLVNPEGTVWEGSAVLVLASGHTGKDALSLPSRLHWRTGMSVEGVKLALSAQCCISTPLQLNANLRRVVVNDGQLQLPVALLKGLGTPWNTLGLQGNMNVLTRGLALDLVQPYHFHGVVETTLTKVSTRLSTLPEVGSYKLTLNGGKAPTVKLSTLRGDLQLSGTGNWQGRKFVFRGEAKATSANAAALNNLLTLLGDRQGGVTKIKLG